jgi:hypothetical protein
MQKIIVFLFFTIFLLPLNASNLIDFYKKSPLKFQADPNFGKGVDWESIFYYRNISMVVVPDGSIFVINPGEHKIYKFNEQGKLVKTFGRKGEGPGDFYFPGDLSVLDGKYLIIGEYATNRRVSIFNFSGECVKVIKTSKTCFFPTALSNNHIAFYTTESTPAESDKKVICFENLHSIIVKNIDSNKEDTIDQCILLQCGLKLQGGMISVVENHMGEPFLACNKDGDLMVGVSNTPIIKIFSTKGQLKRKFELKIKPIPVRAGYIQQVKKYNLESLKEQPKIPPPIKKEIEKADFESFFGEYLPYYRQIFVDSEGNILVFLWPDDINSSEKFQVYSPEGKLICESTIDDSIYRFNSARTWKNLQFTAQGIFGVLPLDKDDDIHMRLIKVPIK